MSFTGFIDAYPPGHIKGFPFTSSPRTSTDITAVKSGSERRNQNWEQPLHRFLAPQAIRSQADFEAVKDMWWTLGGPFRTFAFPDPLDQASAPMSAPNVRPSVAATDQLIGVTDGLTRFYQLRKAYEFGGETVYRSIALPVLASVVLALDGASLAAATGGPYTATVSRPGGVIEFPSPPVAGLDLTAGFYFDVQARFEADDSFDGIVQNYRLAGFADLTFLEVRAC